MQKTETAAPQALPVLPAGAGEAVRLAEEHFMGAKLGNRARTRRLAASAARVLAHPQGTVPEKMGSAAHLQGLYKLLACERVTHQSVLEAHRQVTLGRMREEPVVLVVNDWTELDYAHVEALADALGPVGNGNRRGYICHNSLAVTPDGRTLGLARQCLHRRREVPRARGRDGRKGRRTEGALAKRLAPGRESRLWVKAAEAVGEAPAGSLWVKVSDRGSDTFGYAAHELRSGGHFVIRAAKDRRLHNAEGDEGEGPEHIAVAGDRVCQGLFEYARDLPPLGEREVRVAAVPGKSAARAARVRVSAGPVRLKAPHFCRGEAGEPWLDLWAVRVAEAHGSAPAGAEPLEWVLLTDLAAGTREAAWERVDWYERRPVVEDLHKGMKSGCGVERVQFEKVGHLEPFIALTSVAAAVLLGMRQAARDPAAQYTPAAERVPAEYVRVLSLHRHGEVREMSVRDFHFALAELGGFVKRSAGAFPGWMTLWRGWSRLQDMVRGAGLAATRPAQAEPDTHSKPP